MVSPPPSGAGGLIRRYPSVRDVFSRVELRGDLPDLRNMPRFVGRKEHTTLKGIERSKSPMLEPHAAQCHIVNAAQRRTERRARRFGLSPSSIEVNPGRSDRLWRVATLRAVSNHCLDRRRKHCLVRLRLFDCHAGSAGFGDSVANDAQVPLVNEREVFHHLSDRPPIGPWTVLTELERNHIERAAQFGAGAIQAGEYVG